MQGERQTCFWSSSLCLSQCLFFSLFLLILSPLIFSHTPHLPHLYLSVCIYYSSHVLYFLASFCLLLFLCLFIYFHIPPISLCPCFLHYIHLFHIAGIHAAFFSTEVLGNRDNLSPPPALFGCPLFLFVSLGLWPLTRTGSFFLLIR